MTSPSRKIDPATTIRGDILHTAASASVEDGSIAIGSAGAILRAESASMPGSAERGFDAPLAGARQRGPHVVGVERVHQVAVAEQLGAKAPRHSDPADDQAVQD